MTAPPSVEQVPGPVTPAQKALAHSQGVHVSARADYAVRACVALATSDGWVKSDAVAAQEQIPAHYLRSILGALCRTGLVSSRRGPDGGYGLARPASTISVADVIRAADDGESAPGAEEQPVAAGDLQLVWRAVHARVRGVLEQVSVADLATSRLPDAIRQLAETVETVETVETAAPDPPRGAVTRSGC